ncbi:DHA2 family efflux MFS transporter permease subunit [Aerosticca soli]|jgi:DHA2 family multidrug resistance protein|uniref:Inner membrane component of tripartite multidrug resistance system n=1 Tax=Aerosticca soli TaxID=2010829 RepID=A0A2Z6E7W5_9GAMM|nr:DHA2 family efflux MFS transporter permease subunit [Aerosticca soli]BBD81230.1 inner membrane component of tripartite multidrug resistance system [Aerosticca soli]
MSTSFRPPNLALTTIGLSLATFMQVLDTTIANVSLPTIAGNLGVSVNQSTWVITSFAVSNAIALPLTGFLTRRFGEVKLFVWATMLFSLASFLCGVAQSMNLLIGFRALQGAVAGPMYPITQALLISVYPPSRRAMALSLLSMVTVVAPIAGPILGGWITDNYSWPWIFFINVPIGIFASTVVANQMRGRADPTSRPRMDYVGLITLIVGVGALQIVLDKGNDEDWFNSHFIVVTTIVAAIGLAIFLIWELTDEHPIVDLKLFRHHNFRYGTLALVLSYASFFSIGLLVPQWLQRNLGYTSTWAGLAAAPIGVMPVLLTFMVGKYAMRMDLRLLASAAFLVMSLTCFMRSDFYLDIDFKHVALVQLFQGLGVALFFMPVITILLSDLQNNEIAAGSGLATFLRTLAASFSASLTTYMWERRAVVHHAQLTEHISPYDPIANDWVQQLGGGEKAYASINQMITQQGYQISFNEVFHVLGWIFLSLILVIWLTRPPFGAKGGAEASGGH